MPSDWPHVFFGERRQALLPPPPQAIRPFHDLPVHPPHTPVPPLKPEQATKWPDLFFKKLPATERQSAPITPAPLPDFAQPPGPAETPRKSVRIPVPVASRSNNVDLPVVTLPVRKTARVPVPAAPATPVPPPSNGHTPPGASSVVLVTGETISGTILSDKGDLVFLKHDTLGVITIPKSAIASRHVRLVLQNGDTVAGEWIVDTPELLVIRSAMLGTLSVPRSSIKALG